MKKIAVMLAAVLMIFAFAACDDGGDEARPMTVKLMEEGVTIYGKNVHAFVSDDFTLSSTKASGTINYVSPLDDDEGIYGYFIPIEIVSPAAVDADTRNLTAMLLNEDGSNNALNQYIEKQDGRAYFIAWVSGVNDIDTTEAIQARDLVLRYFDANNVIYMATIDLSEVEFAPNPDSSTT